MKKQRLERLESIALQLIGEFFLEEIEPQEKQEFGIITITKIKISSDLSYLDVFVSSIKNSSKLTKFLAEKNINIQRKFNKSLPLRKFPRIRYRLDESGEKSSNILDTMGKIEEELEKNLNN